MNNNLRCELTGRLFLYFVQTTAVVMEKLKIDYERELDKGRPSCLNLFLPQFTILSIFD